MRHSSITRSVEMSLVSTGLLLVLLGFCGLEAQSTSTGGILPQPAGPFAIGRVTYHWVDSSRVEVFSSDPAARREIMVDVWYPARPMTGGRFASYLPDLPTIRQVLANERWVKRRSGIGAADIRFVIDQLTRHSRDSSLGAPFLGQLDLDRVGALGHSAGGQMAAHACQTDPRIKACLNQDGVSSNLPFGRDPQGRTMDQPFLYFGRVEPVPPPPTDSQQVPGR